MIFLKRTNEEAAMKRCTKKKLSCTDIRLCSVFTGVL